MIRTAISSRSRTDHAVTLSAAVETWLVFGRQYTPETQIQYQKVIGRFQRTITAITAADITPGMIRAYMIGLQKTKIKARTINSHLIAIKSFCRFCCDLYGVDNPAAAVHNLKTDPPTARFLTQSEYLKVTAVDQPHRDMLIFLANTGLRAAEFSQLRQQDITADLSSLVVIGKGRKKRIIPLNSICKETLQNNPAINIIDGRPVKHNTLYYICKRTAKKIPILRFGPHSLRHYFATRLLLSGVDIAIVSKLLGHGSIQTTEQTYIHIMPADLAGVTECLIDR